MIQPQSYNPLAYDALSESISRELMDSDPIRLTDIDTFSGSGIYALFYEGDFAPYETLAKANGLAHASIPIYVGKAAPSARKGEDVESDPAAVFIGTRLFDRVRNHKRSIELASNLSVDDFSVRLLRLTCV